MNDVATTTVRMDAILSGDPLEPVDAARAIADGESVLDAYRFDAPNALMPGDAGHAEAFAKVYYETSRTATLARIVAACVGRPILTVTTEGAIAALRQAATAESDKAGGDRILAALRILSRQQGVTLNPAMAADAVGILKPQGVVDVMTEKSTITDADVLCVAPDSPIQSLLSDVDMPSTAAAFRRLWTVFHEIGHLHAHMDGLDIGDESPLHTHRHECYADTFAAAMMLRLGASRSYVMASAVLNSNLCATAFIEPASWPNGKRIAGTGVTPAEWLWQRLKSSWASKMSTREYMVLPAMLEGLAHVGWAPGTIAEVRTAARYGAGHGALAPEELRPGESEVRIAERTRRRCRALMPVDVLREIEEVIADKIAAARPLPASALPEPPDSLETAWLQHGLLMRGHALPQAAATAHLAGAHRNFLARYQTTLGPVCEPRLKDIEDSLAAGRWPDRVQSPAPAC